MQKADKINLANVRDLVDSEREARMWHTTVKVYPNFFLVRRCSPRSVRCKVGLGMKGTHGAQNPGAAYILTLKRFT